MNAEHFFILADGCENSLSEERLHRLSSGRFFVALDGACKFLRDLGIVPDVILGDMDSVDRDTLDYFEKMGSKIVVTPDQDFSDLEKGIMFCRKHGGRSINIFNACYGRMDHFIGNVFFLKKYHAVGCPIRMFTEQSCMLFLRDEIVDLHVIVGAKCGFFGLPRCTLSVSNVEYELNQKSLILGESESVANEFTSENIRCEVRGDCLMTYEF